MAYIFQLVAAVKGCGRGFNARVFHFDARNANPTSVVP